MTTKSLHLMLATAFAVAATAVIGAGSAFAYPTKPVDLVPLGNSAPQGAASAEIAAYHPASKRAFVTDAAHNQLDIFDISAPGAPTLISSVNLAPYGSTPNSVAVSKRCGGRVVVAQEGAVKTDPGKLLLFNTSGTFITSKTVGAQPDNVVVSSGGLRFISANEGEPADNGSVDPAGTVSTATMRGCNDMTVITDDFSGVPLVGDVRVFGPSATALTNLEPEYVAFAADRTTAFVTVQEANAIATLNVVTGQLTSVKSLGYKDYSLPANKLDPSDQDGGIHIANWNNLYGMYQPDAIAAYKLPKESHTRFITANEGDTREWTYYSESKRVNQLTLDPTAFPNGEKTNAKLGRLTVTNTKGDTDNDGDFDQLYVYGGRSVSILDHNAGITWDSGDQMEQFVAASAPTTFNWECGAGAVDSRSDNKGPEPEGITVGKFKGRHYAFVGLERQGGLLAYDLRAVDGQAKQAGYVNNCLTNSAPEGISYIAAEDSPTADPIVMTASEGSGTLGLYAVRTP